MYQPGCVPNNPVKEHDEIYIKEEKKIHQISLTKLASDHSFSDEIEKLKPEIKLLS